MKEFAKVYQVCDLIEGQSDNGQFWSRQTVVVETCGTTPRKLALECWGDRKTNITRKLEKGMMVEVVYNVESRPYQDRWFTQLDCVSITPFVQMHDPKV